MTMKLYASSSQQALWNSSLIPLNSIYQPLHAMLSTDAFTIGRSTPSSRLFRPVALSSAPYFSTNSSPENSHIHNVPPLDLRTSVSGLSCAYVGSASESRMAMHCRCASAQKTDCEKGMGERKYKGLEAYTCNNHWGLNHARLLHPMEGGDDVDGEGMAEDDLAVRASESGPPENPTDAVGDPKGFLVIPLFRGLEGLVEDVGGRRVGNVGKGEGDVGRLRRRRGAHERKNHSGLDYGGLD